MKFKEFFKSFYKNIKEGISRFLTAFICTLLAFLTISYEIVFETNADEIIIPLCMSYALVAILSVVLKTLKEYLYNKLGCVIQYCLCAASGVIAYLLINANYDSIYTLMVYSGIIIAFLCFIFFILMRGENKNLAFPKLVTSLVFSGAVCGVISGGLSICIAAFESLIFSWDNIYKLYLIVNLFVWVICFINIFLSFIPQKELPLSQSKIFRAFVLFAGLPLYILLIAILLIYLAKIVITWNMPVGEINWFASFASLFFIFFLLSVMQYTEKPAKLFAKFGGYLLVPVLIMQAIAVFERINAYGLTTPRTVSLVLIIISVLFILGSIITPKHLNKIPLISGIIVLIVTITPFNVIDMPIKSQTNILTNVLTANDMLKDGKIVPKSDISDRDAEKIISSYEYLKYNAGKTPDFIPDSEKSIQEIFGFAKKDDYIDTHYNFRTNDSVDITDYNQIIRSDNYDTVLYFDHNGKQYNIDLKQIANNLYAQYGREEITLDLYKVDENTALYFSNFSFGYENGTPINFYFDGYILLKN